MIVLIPVGNVLVPIDIGNPPPGEVPMWAVVLSLIVSVVGVVMVAALMLSVM